MIFASDNWAGASDAVTARLAGAASDAAPSYGADPLTEAATAALGRFFEREVAVYFVATGTAANSLALASTARPGGVVLCHEGAHILADEAGAPTMLGGLRLVPVQGRHGKIGAAALQAAFDRFGPGFSRLGQPVALSLTQASEAGTAYTPPEIAALAALAHRAGAAVHMDGARFANALVHLGASPADMTWRAGIDLMSLGFTKNGAWCAEAVVFFNDGLAKDFAYRRMAAGHLFSKSRFVAAQVLAMLEDDHWRTLAAHANRMAAMLAEPISRLPAARLAWPCQSNEVFAFLGRDLVERLRGAGATFYSWPTPAADDAAGQTDGLPPDAVLCRLVTSFRTSSADVERFVALIEADSAVHT